MADVTITRPYPGGWKDLPLELTDIDAAALDQMEDNTQTVLDRANDAYSTAVAAGDAATVAILSLFQFPVANYASVTAAILACYTAGGGSVLLPPGPTYIDQWGVRLLSRVTLRGVPCRHSENQFTNTDGSGYWRPFNINPATGIAGADISYLVPTAGSTGPMVWATDFDRSYAIKDLLIFGVDVYGTNITPTTKPAWTNAAGWVDTNASTTNGSLVVQLTNVQAMPQMVGAAVTGSNIPAGATVASVNVGANQITLNAAHAATATATGGTIAVAGGMQIPVVGVVGRQGICLGSGRGVNRSRSIIDNVFLWGCGSGGPGSTINFRTYTETNGATANGSTTVPLSVLKASPLMVGLPITGSGIPANTTVIAIAPAANQVVLSSPATATATGVTLTIGDSTSTSVLQAVYSGNCAAYVGTDETIVRGLSVFMGDGDGLVIDAQDCQIDADNLFGFNHGWGLRTTINSGPVRAVGAIDSYFNGWYSTAGAGGALIEGSGHRFVSLQSNNNAQQNVKFGRCINTRVICLDSYNGGAFWANNGTRYNGVSFASPAASSSNPIWPTGSNGGVQIVGAYLTTNYGFEDHLVKNNENVVSLPSIVELVMTGTVWAGGTPASDGLSQASSWLSSLRVLHSPQVPDSLRAAPGTSFAPFIGPPGSANYLELHDGSGAFLAGFTKLGALATTNGTTRGPTVFGGSGAPNIAASIAGDMYIRSDTPSTANQRVYIATAANTWTGIL